MKPINLQDPGSSQESYERKSPYFQKFLDEKCQKGCTVEVTVVREQKPRIKTVRGNGPFRILTIAGQQDMKGLRMADLLEPFNVVLVSTGLLGTKHHMDRVRDTLNDWLWEDEYKCYAQPMSARQEKLRECVDRWHQKDSFLQAALQSPALLETMWWNRMPWMLCVGWEIGCSSGENPKRANFSLPPRGLSICRIEIEFDLFTWSPWGM